MLDSIKTLLINLPGWRTNRKIVVIQSDDWGSIRMPTLKIREHLDNHPLIKADDAYCYNDTLASAEDLEALFDVLTSVKDKNGNPAVLTANCVMANPDFEAIKKKYFEKYVYETLEKTFERYHNEKALTLWKEGLDREIFIPQFHGREHVNVPFWMEKLREGHKGIKAAFDKQVFGVNFLNLGQEQVNVQRAWDLLSENAENYINKSIEEGLKLFYEEFGYQSETAIAPNYTWSPFQEELLKQKGVNAMQGILKQRLPNGYKKQYAYKYRFTSNKVTPNRLRYLRRNVFFEPALEMGKFDFSEPIERIKIAFRVGKPAIIGTHRINFTSRLSTTNRDHNIDQLKNLLHTVTKKWPDVEFMGSNKLAEIFVN